MFSLIAAGILVKPANGPPMAEIDDDIVKLRREMPNVEKKVQKELDKTILTLKDSMEKFEKELKGYNLDTLSVTFKLSEKVLGAGTEQDIEVTFKRNAPAS